MPESRAPLPEGGRSGGEQRQRVGISSSLVEASMKSNKALACSARVCAAFARVQSST